MEKEIENARISQISILSWALNIGNKTDSNALLCIIPNRYFGQYAKIADFIRINWPEYTPEFAHYIVNNSLSELYIGLKDPEILCIEPYQEAKTLCRIALGDISNKIDVVEALKYFETIISEIDALRSNAKISKSLWEEVFLKLECDMIEAKNNPVPTLWIKTGFNTIDSITDGFRKGTVTRLNAYPNTGKSKFSYNLTNNLIKQWKNGLYISLEVWQREVALNLSANWFGIDYYDLAKWRKIPDFSQYPKDLIKIVDDIRRMDEIEMMVEKTKPDFVVIDYVQKIRVDWTSIYEKMSEVANRIQDMAVRNNVMVFDLSQVTRWNKDFSKWDEIPSKWAWELVEAADIGLVLTRKTWDTFLELHVAKNKFGENNISISLWADYGKSTFYDHGELKDKWF